MGNKITTTSDEMLHYLESQGIINLDTIAQEVEMTKKEKIRKKYLDMNPSKLWQDKKGEWFVYLPDSSRKNGRVKRHRHSKKDLEDLVISYWMEHEEKPQLTSNMTLKELFPMWLSYKELSTSADSTVKRILSDWKKYYQNDEIINKSICTYNKIYLKEWALRLIKKQKLTKKQYYNMTLIIRQALDYLVDLEVIPTNIFKTFTINSDLFEIPEDKDKSTEVYTYQEEIILKNTIDSLLGNNHNDVLLLAIKFWFSTGLRVGEIAALHFDDIDFTSNVIRIHRQLTKEYSQFNGENSKFVGYHEVKYAKKHKTRTTFLIEDSKKILLQLLDIYTNLGLNKPIYVFSKKDGSFYEPVSFEYWIKKACQTAGIKYKPGHKIRKSYASALIDSGVNIDVVRDVLGHTDAQTTYRCYCFGRYSNEDTLNQFEAALSPK